MLVDFIKWCEGQSLQLPTVQENTRRSGIRGQYPDAYAGRGYAYPDSYWAPKSATAFLDLKNAKRDTKSVKDTGGHAAN